MKRYEFPKVIALNPIPPKDIHMLWADVNENTGKIIWIKEFQKGINQWVSILDNDSQDTEANKEATISANGEFTVNPSTGYNAMKKATITVNVPATESTFASIRHFGGALDTETNFTTEMLTPITTSEDKTFPIKVLDGTSAVVIYGSLLSEYVSGTSTSQQKIEFVKTGAVVTFTRTYNTETSTWGTWAVPTP